MTEERPENLPKMAAVVITLRNGARIRTDGLLDASITRARPGGPLESIDISHDPQLPRVELPFVDIKEVVAIEYEYE